MKRIEYFYQNLRHEDPIEEQILEAKRSGIIKSYFLTTLSAMNAKRDTDFCLWCDAIWSVHHSCEHAPDYNCRFTFGEDDDGMAFVKVTKEGLKPMKAQHSVEEELHPNADNMCGELCVSNISNSCILQEREVVSRVDQMFDEIPVPNPTLNQAQMVRVNQVCETNSSISSKAAILSSAHQVFDEVSQTVLNPNQDNNALMSYSDNNDEIQVKDGCTRGYEDEATQMDGIRSSQNQQLMEELNVFRGETDSHFIEEIKQPNAYKLLDELPLPTFIKEMAEASKTTEVESIQGDYELKPAIQKVQGDHFTHKQLCAKLCTLEGSHLRDLVIIYANRMRFSTILGSLFNGCQLSDKMPHKVDNSCGNSYSECPCFEVSAKSFVMLNADHSSKFIENVVSPLLLSDIDWFIGSSISMILGVNVYKPKVVELEHTRRSRSNFKGVYKWDKHLNCKDYGIVKLTLLPLNFGHHFTMKLILMRGWYMFSDTCGSGSVGVTLVNGILVAIFQPNVNPCTTWISIPYDPGILVIDLSPLVFTYIHENKGVFRGDEGINREQTWLLLNPMVWSNYNANRMRESAVFLTNVFDPGGLWDALLHSSWCSNPNLGFCMSYLTICVPLLSNMPCSRIMAMINAFSLGHETVLNIRYDSFILLIASYLKGVWYLTFDRGSCDHSKVLHAHVGVPTFIIDHIVSKSAAMSTHNNCATNGHVIWPKEYIVSTNFIWDPGIIAKIAYEKFRTSNVSRVGCRKDIILLTLGLMKYWAASSRISDVGTLGFDSFEYVLRSLKISEVLLLGTVEQWSITMRTMLEKNSARKDRTINCKFSTIMTISSLVFDPGGRKYNLSHVESLTSMFAQPTKIFLSQLNLLRHSQYSDCAHAVNILVCIGSTVMKFREQAFAFLLCIGPMNAHVRVILIFDPGGYGYWQEMMHRLKAYGGNKFNEKTYKDGQFYVFDSGGLLRIQVVDALMRRVFDPGGKYHVTPCFKY